MLGKYMKQQYHTIEIFSINRPLCRHVIYDVQIGKCEGCSQIVNDVNNMTEELSAKMKEYGVKAVSQLLLSMATLRL
jgi:hypothetical protein